MWARLPWTRGAVVLHVVGSAMVLGSITVLEFTQWPASGIGDLLILLSFIVFYFSRRLRRAAAGPDAAERGRVPWLSP